MASNENVIDPEEISVIRKQLPYSRDQALELSSEVVKLLSKDTAYKEDFDIDEEPLPTKKTGVESWLSSVTTSANHGSWMKAALEITGCLVKKMEVEVKFASKKGFATKLAQDPTPGWVLEQALVTRKEVENVCRALKATTKLKFEDPDDLLRLCECLDVATSGLSRARNALLYPNPLGFPRSLRPFNGFTPPLGQEYLLDFSIFRDKLVVAAFRVNIQSVGQAGQQHQAVVPDRWFDDPSPPAPSRLVGMSIVFESGSVVKILEHHSVSFQVALFTKVQVFLGDAHRVLRDLSMNATSCLSVRPDFFLSSVRKSGEGNGEIPEMEDDDIWPLIQPSKQVNQQQ